VHWRTFSVRAAAYAVTLTVVAVVLLSAVPLATGGLSVEVAEGAREVTFEDGTIVVTVPVEVRNGGLFAFRDVQVTMRASAEGALLAEGTSAPRDVPARETTRLDPTFTVDPDEVDHGRLAALVFEGARLDVEVEVKAGYSLGLVSTTVNFIEPMDWEPLVGDLQFDPSAADWQANGTGFDLLLPYSFTASELVQGQAAELRATVGTATAVLGSGSTDLVLQPSNDGVLRISVDPSAAASLLEQPQELVVGLGLDCLGATVHFDRTYQWEGAP